MVTVAFPNKLAACLTFKVALFDPTARLKEYIIFESGGSKRDGLSDQIENSDVSANSAGWPADIL